MSWGRRSARGLLVLLLLAAPGLAQEFRPGRVTDVNGYRVHVDEAKATFEIETEKDVDPRVKELGAKFVPTFRLYPTFAAARPGNSFLIPSVAEIDAFTCELDDRLIATLELLMDRGLPGQFIGRAAVLRRLESAVCGGGGPACAFLAASQEIGGAEPRNRPDRAEVDAFKAAFRASSAATPSIGIYSSSPELDCVFQQAKFLQQGFDANGALMAGLRRALTDDAALCREYQVLNDLPAVITSWFTVPDALHAGDKGAAALFPASRSPDGDLIKEVFAAGIPDGVDVVREVAKAVRSGKVKLEPSERAGWYDRRLFAMEPLVREEAAAEESKIRRGADYATRCEQTFVAMLTRLREAHCKQLELPLCGAYMPNITRPLIQIAPEFRLEPQPTVYRRAAESYAWLKRRLGDVGGARLLGSPVVLAAPAPPSQHTIGEVLDFASGFYELLAETSMADLGMPTKEGRYAPTVTPGSDFDPRVCVPFAYDLNRRRYRCSAIIGVRVVRGWISYENPPVVSVMTADGKAVPLDTVELKWTEQPIALAIPVVEEVWLKTPITREDLRKLCDANQTHEKIREALARLQ